MLPYRKVNDRATFDREYQRTSAKSSEDRRTIVAIVTHSIGRSLVKQLFPGYTSKDFQMNSPVTRQLVEDVAMRTRGNDWWRKCRLESANCWKLTHKIFNHVLFARELEQLWRLRKRRHQGNVVCLRHRRQPITLTQTR